MGFSTKSCDLLNRHIAQVGGLKGCRMLELGNQQQYHLYGEPAAKIWFEAQGVAHTSVDLNGKDGALPLDLSKVIDRPAWVGGFDVVTDYGTGEHVQSLYACRANCHQWCRPGGLLVFMNPKTGNYPLHGIHYFVTEHYVRLAAACNYRILELNDPVQGWRPADAEVCVALLKQGDAPFISEAAFAEVCKDTVFLQ